MISFSADQFRELPSFAHFTPFWTPTSTWPSHEELSKDCVVGFVPPSLNKDVFSAHYEVRIAEKKEVETRLACMHDLCNALTWKGFPMSKWALNQRYYRALCERKESWTRSKKRSKEEDVCTVINENGLIIAYTHTEDKDAVQAFQWHDLFWKRREGLKERMELFFLGHALLEKSIRPYIGMTGHGIFVPVHRSFFSLPSIEKVAHIDKALCSILLGQDICSIQDLSPFPVLGFPGFVDAAEKECFYENTRYFRSGRTRKTKR